jgi:hypothetical protein
MSTSAPTNSISFRVQENVTFSKDFGQFLLQLTDLYQKLAVSTNAKDIADYENIELINGQQFFGVYGSIDPQKKIQIYRKCFAFGSINAGATLNIAHGVTLTQLTRLYGTCYTKVGDYRPIPRVSATTATQQIQIDATTTNIVIVNGAAAPIIEYGLVVMEYMKN